jgi:hypothetical protein
MRALADRYSNGQLELLTDFVRDLRAVIEKPTDGIRARP